MTKFGTGPFSANGITCTWCGEDLCDEACPNPWTKFVTKDSGRRQDYPSGMVRDSQDDKSRFDLFLAENIPYKAQFLTRIGDLLYRGSIKYQARNHEKSNSPEELERMKASALRHLVQWLSGETDEDHAAAVAVNLFMAESLKYRMERNATNVSE